MARTPVSGLWAYPARVWGVVLALIFAAEFTVMQALPWLLPVETSWYWASALDGVMLTIVVAPVMWWTCVRPLQQVNSIRARFLADLFAQIEFERRRIAAELHDSVGQSLTLLVSRLRTLNDIPGKPNMPERLQELQNVAQMALKDIRHIALGLRPSLLDDLGLAPAIERVAAEVQEHHTLKVTVNVADLDGKRLPDAIETAVFRIFQEAINNAVKHAAATRVSVRVRWQGEEVVLQVGDNGNGFDMEEERSGASSSGRLGLLSMRERATLLGGTLTIDSNSGGGTRVTATIPTGVPAEVLKVDKVP